MHVAISSVRIERHVVVVGMVAVAALDALNVVAIVTFVL